MDQPALLGSKERVDEVMTHREKVVTCSPCDSIDKGEDGGVISGW